MAYFSLPYDGFRPFEYPFDDRHTQLIEPTCTECVTDCQDEACAAGKTCTDQCVVVACSDPNHSSTPCSSPCNSECEAACGVDVGLASYPNAPDPNYDYFSNYPERWPLVNHAERPLSWNDSLDAFLCSRGDIFQHEPQRESVNSGGRAFPSQAVSTAPPAYAPSLPSSMPSPSPFSDQLTQPVLARSHASSPASVTTNTGSLNMMACMWNNCTASFRSLAELVGHVNLEHLRVDAIHLPSAPVPPPIKTDGLSCQWGNCHDYPTANSIPGSSSSTSLHAALGVLAEHLMHDHLGVQASSTSPLTEASHIQSIQHIPSSPQSLEDIASDGSAAEGSEMCFCRWQDCGLGFGSVGDLTAHITTAHVGGGKAHYDCFWAGCTRNGEKGFSSKQKICRHIQSHTGHRPFQCQVCKQNFSEAATLQQHMRRHTQEKPYMCDFPGCGKAFAIAGALTIHKRTHNGQKPFKCTYCDRAFSESSNLSKHLRTHTGVRPYLCSEPGCGKAFSRPDQLARHATVHKKGVSS